MSYKDILTTVILLKSMYCLFVEAVRLNGVRVSLEFSYLNVLKLRM